MNIYLRLKLVSCWGNFINFIDFLKPNLMITYICTSVVLKAELKIGFSVDNYHLNADREF